MNIWNNNILVRHLDLPLNTCLKLSIQGKCQYAACSRLHLPEHGNLDITRLKTGFTSLINSDFFDSTRRTGIYGASSTLDREIDNFKES